jgi:tRNA nucleotidyltransferase/poly(A) polymerase
MPVQVEEILGKLREHGYEAFAVGGCVRDAILGRILGAPGGGEAGVRSHDRHRASARYGHGHA